jgi:hypothetical protein
MAPTYSIPAIRLTDNVLRAGLNSRFDEAARSRKDRQNLTFAITSDLAALGLIGQKWLPGGRPPGGRDFQRQ